MTYHYYSKFKTSNLIISNNSSPFTVLLDRLNVICKFKCPFGDYVSKENNTYVSLTTTTLSRRLTMHLNDVCFTALYLKKHSIPKSRFRKFLVENTIIIVHEINKLQLQVLEPLHIKIKKTHKIKRNTFEKSSNVFKYLFFYIQYFLIIFHNRW